MSTTPTQGFQLHPSLAGLDPEELRKRYDAAGPDMRRALGFVRPATSEEFAKENEPHGAPEDFGGAVYTSSTPPVVSDDTDPGIPVTPMPIGVSFHRQNAIAPPALNLSNPPAAQFLGQGITTVGAKMAPAAKMPPASMEWQDFDSKQQAGWQDLAPKPTRPDFSKNPPAAGKPTLDMQPEPTPLDYAKQGGKMLLNAFTGTPGAVATDELSGKPKTGTLAIRGLGEIATPGRRLRGGLDLANAGMDVATPFLGPAAAENPVGVARVIGRGIAGQQVGRHGAELFGADPDQAELSGDIGGALSAGLGQKVPGIVRSAAKSRLGQSAGVIAKATGELPVLGGFVKAGRALGQLGDIWAPKPVYPGAPFPEAPSPVYPGAPFPEPMPVRPIAGQLRAKPIEVSSSATPIDTSPEGLLEANRRVVRDPSTGKMKVQYVTSSGGKVIPDEVAIAKSQNRARLADNLDTKGVQETFRNDLNREGQRVRAPFAETPLTKSQSAELFQASRPVEVPGESAAEFERRGAPRDLGSDADQAYLKVLENKIATNAPDRLQAIERRTDLLNRMQGIEVKPSELTPEERAQAGKTRKMSQPRAVVAAPTEARKNLALQPADFLKSRQMQRTQSGAPSSPAQPSKADIAKAMREGTYQWKRR